MQDWLVQRQQTLQNEAAFLKKLTQVTIYDHNSVLRVVFPDLQFKYQLSCKKLNRQFSIIGKIYGNLYSRIGEITCSLVGFNKIITGRTAHQKVQLTKFAYRYNQKSARASTSKSEDNGNYLIKVNPISGQFCVCEHFALEYDLIQDYEGFKVKMTDECQKLTCEVQKIFNTIIQVIFDQQANDPYLKSDEKIGMHFSRPVKMSKLLKKIKKMNTISCFYKIRQDIASQNKYRSTFKKVFLKKSEKCIHNPLIIQSALVFVPKFCKKHIDALPESAQPSKKKNSVISPFEDLQDNHELEFATRHLQDFSKKKAGDNITELTNLTPQEKTLLMQPGVYNVRGVIIQVEKIGKQKKIFQYELVNKLGLKHPHIAHYFHIKGQQFINLRITQYIEQITLQEYLDFNGQTLSLATRLELMTQICHVMEALHRFNIGYFLEWKNIYLVDGMIKIKDFTTAYSICNWDQTKLKDKDFLDKKFLMSSYKDFLIVCGFGKVDDSSNKDRMEEERERDKAKFECQRADIFSLGLVLYKILVGKFPFNQNAVYILQNSYRRYEDTLAQMWTVDTEYYLSTGGMVAKLLAQLLLKCLYMQVEKRPYVEWLTVILSEVKSSIECLY